MNGPGPALGGVSNGLLFGLSVDYIEHLYTKIGASNRAEASLFAVRNALMTIEEGEFHP